MSNTDDWFSDKVCTCAIPTWGHGTWDDTSLTLSERLAAAPPSCMTCGKWHKSRIYTCAKCNCKYVNWFAHPANGYYPDKGVYCYFCLEALHPTGAIWTYARTSDWMGGSCTQKIPPADSIVSPTHVGTKKPTYDSDTAARLAKFRELLKGL